MSRVTRASRAAKYEMVYRALGAERSVASVFAIAKASGDPVGRNTLEQYSADYGWPERAQEWDREREQAAAAVFLDSAIVDTVRHATFGRMMQEVATLAMTRKLGDPEGLDLTGSEIARLGAEGIKIERMASGLATERIEVMSSAMRVVIEDIGPLVRRAFERLGALYETHVRPVDDGLANLLHAGSEEVLAEFGADADRVVDATFRAQGLLLEQASVPSSDDDEDEEGR